MTNGFEVIGYDSPPQDKEAMEAGEAGEGIEPKNAIENACYTGLIFLNATPRQITDIWFAFKGIYEIIDQETFPKENPDQAKASICEDRLGKLLANIAVICFPRNFHLNSATASDKPSGEHRRASGKWDSCRFQSA